MKEKGQYRRFDGIAVLAGLGCLGMMLFQAVFVFELYRFDSAKIEPFIPDAAKPLWSRWFAAEDSIDAELPNPPADEPVAEPSERQFPVEEPGPVEKPEPSVEEVVPVG